MSGKLYPLHTEGPDLIFGFSTIYFGLLAIASVLVFLVYKRRGTLPKIGEPYYEIFVLALGLWWLGGLLIDAFAHISGVVDDTFFTPWHAIWYAGATAYGAYMFYAIFPEEGLWGLVRNPLKTLRDISPEHRPGVYGILLFGLSGFGDMIWHETLGVETSVDILLSPAHIGLFIGLMMAVTAPMWSAWANKESGRDGLRSQILIIFGLGAAWAIFLLPFLYANLWFESLEAFCYDGGRGFCWNNDYDFVLMHSMRSLIIQVGLTSAILLLFIRRWTPARGSLVVLLVFPAIGGWFYGEFDNTILFLGIVWAIVVEFMLPVLWKGWKRLFVALVVGSQVVVFMASWWLRPVQLPGGLYWIEGTNLHVLPFGWSIHATIGSIIFCAILGWLASCVVSPPEIPDLDDE